MIRNRTRNQLGSTPMRMPEDPGELDRAAAEHALILAGPVTGH